MLLFLGCNSDDPSWLGKDSEEDTGTTWVSHPDTDSATGSDADMDNDGFTPADGDCDDNDVWVSPAREEDEDDGKDNDCDGRVDEDWEGVTVAYVGESGSAFYLLNASGTDAEVVNTEAAPYSFDTLADGSWLVMSNYSEVGTVDSAGNYSMLADFSDTETYEYGVYAVAVGTDGSFYASLVDRLVQIGGDGTVTEVGSWVVDWEDNSLHELAITGLSVDPKTGTVGLYDYFGGFGTWSAASGVQVLKRGDWAAATLATFTGSHADDGGWYTVGTSATGYGVYGWEGSDWALVEEWSDEDWTPYALTPGDDEDFYISANGGWFPTVWRVVVDSGYAADFYVTDGSEPSSFYTIQSRW